MDPLFIIGCIFPTIGWITFITSSLYQWTTGKYSSAVFIPIIGPAVLNIWSLGEGHEWWAYLLPWALDISTIAFFLALPALIKDEFNYSRYNNQLTLESTNGIQLVKLMLQKNNTYICHFTWKRNKSDLGIIATTDRGEYDQYDGECIRLKSHTGKVRFLKLCGGEYFCEDLESEDDCNLHGHIFA